MRSFQQSVFFKAQHKQCNNLACWNNGSFISAARAGLLAAGRACSTGKASGSQRFVRPVSVWSSENKARQKWKQNGMSASLRSHLNGIVAQTAQEVLAVSSRQKVTLTKMISTSPL